MNDIGNPVPTATITRMKSRSNRFLVDALEWAGCGRPWKERASEDTLTTGETIEELAVMAAKAPSLSDAMTVARDLADADDTFGPVRHGAVAAWCVLRDSAAA